ncbi:MAG: ParB N-terminal domain-containing protein [Candidatus Nitrosotenuis sp.]
MNLNFKLVPISQIKIGTRLRKDLGDISSLTSSIEQIGLLQPIVLTEDLRLVAGERRLTAVQKLGWKEIPAVILVSNHSEVVV